MNLKVWAISKGLRHERDSYKAIDFVNDLTDGWPDRETALLWNRGLKSARSSQLSTRRERFFEEL